jgi:hypothetical protein
LSRLLEFGLLLRIGFVIARPCCPPGQPGLVQELPRVTLGVHHIEFLFHAVEEQLRRPRLLLVAEFRRRLVEDFFETLTFIGVKLRRPTGPGIVVGGLLDRFFVEPIEPVVDDPLDDAVTLGQRAGIVSLLVADRREHPLSWDRFLRLLSKLVKLFERNFIESTHYPQSRRLV